MNTLKCCETCKYWDRWDAGTSGLCTRYAPKPKMRGEISSEQEEGQQEAIWPFTLFHMLCGEYKCKCKKGVRIKLDEIQEVMRKDGVTQPEIDELLGG